VGGGVGGGPESSISDGFGIITRTKVETPGTLPYKSIDLTSTANSLRAEALTLVRALIWSACNHDDTSQNIIEKPCRSIVTSEAINTAQLNSVLMSLSEITHLKIRSSVQPIRNPSPNRAPTRTPTDGFRPSQAENEITMSPD